MITPAQIADLLADARRVCKAGDVSPDDRAAVANLARHHARADIGCLEEEDAELLENITAGAGYRGGAPALQRDDRGNYNPQGDQSMSDQMQDKIDAARIALGGSYSPEEAAEIARDFAKRDRRALGWAAVAIFAAITSAVVLIAI